MRTAHKTRELGDQHGGSLRQLSPEDPGGESNAARKLCSEARRAKDMPEHRSYRSMVSRCGNPRDPDYRYYGARGIRVADEWRGRGGFWAFLAHVGERPSPGHTIDRIDVDGHYEPGNVRWATRLEQNANRRDNRHVTIGGITQTVSQWSRDARCSVRRQDIAKRLNRGWEPERAVFAPPGTRRTTTTQTAAKPGNGPG